MPGAPGHPDLAAASEPIASAIAVTPRVLERVRTYVNTPPAAATYVLREGTTLIANPATLNQAINLVVLAAADLTVIDKTPRLRIRATVGVNGTAPASDFSFGLYPVTLTGGTNVIVATLGALVSGSTALVSAPAANGWTTVDSGDFALPADGVYTIAMLCPSQGSANAALELVASLLLRNT